MTSPNFNRFSVLDDLVGASKVNGEMGTSPPSKKSKKKSPPKPELLTGKENVVKGTPSKPTRGKGKSRVSAEPRNRQPTNSGSDQKGTSRKSNRKLVLPSSESENDEPRSPYIEPIEPTEPTPPVNQQSTCPATDFYVRMAREHHSIPTLEQLLDRAGAFGNMFSDGNPVFSKATDIINIDDIYGKTRQRFQDRRVQWETKSSLIFYEQGIHQQLFERQKIILFFSLVKKHKDRLPNLYRMYNSLYQLEQSDII